jgi:hypothetical protein
MTAILENLGYPPELVRWSEAFLRDRKVCLSFNNVIAEERGQPIRVPQGSPLSPVYSITYTLSLLAMMKGWNNSSLVTDLQGPPSERTPEEKLWDFKTRAQQYARDRGSCDDVRISYLEFLETEAEDDLALARMIAG